VTFFMLSENVSKCQHMSCSRVVKMLNGHHLCPLFSLFMLCFHISYYFAALLGHQRKVTNEELAFAVILG